MSFKGKAIRFLNKIAPEGLRTFALTQIIGDYGKMLEFKFDPKEKYLHANILLAGETEPIDIEITDYDLVEQGNTLTITVRQARCDREWIDIALNKMLIGKPIEVPADKAGMVFDIMKS